MFQTQVCTFFSITEPTIYLCLWQCNNMTGQAFCDNIFTSKTVTRLVVKLYLKILQDELAIVTERIFLQDNSEHPTTLK